MYKIDLNACTRGIQKIINNYGMESFNNYKLFVSLLNDILPSQTEGKDVFKTTIRPAILKQVCNVNNSSFYDKKNEISRLEKLIEKECSLSKELTHEVVSVYAKVFSWKYFPETTLPIANTGISSISKLKENTGLKKRSIMANCHKKPLIITGMDTFEFDGTSCNAVKTCGQVFLKSETRHVGAMLTFDRQPPNTDIEVNWQFFYENGKAFTKAMTIKDKLAPKDTYYYASWGWSSPGKWPVGKYKVVMKANNSKEWVSTFEIKDGSYNHPNFKINNLKLFVAGDIVPDMSSRKYGNSFQRNQLQRVYFEVHFDPIIRGYYTKISYKIIDPDGDIFANYAYPLTLQPGNKYCWVGCGWSEAGYWDEGVYKYEISVGNSNKLYGTFVVK